MPLSSQLVSLTVISLQRFYRSQISANQMKVAKAVFDGTAYKHVLGSFKEQNQLQKYRMNTIQVGLVLIALLGAGIAQPNVLLPVKSDCDWRYNNVAWLEKDVCADQLNYPADADARFLYSPENYEFSAYVNNTKKCTTFDNWALDGNQPTYRYKNLCKSDIVEIKAVWYTPIGSHRQACVVHPSQQLYYAKCWHPNYNEGRNSFLKQQCELGAYGSNRDFSCVPGAFIEREVVIFCPEVQQYFFYHARIPTSCTCSMCGCGLEKKIASSSILPLQG